MVGRVTTPMGQACDRRELCDWNAERGAGVLRSGDSKGLAGWLESQL